MNNESYCIASCEKTLDQNYWDSKYKANATGWDLGIISPAIKTYIDTLQDKDIAILIPGCGNTYEATYLLEQGFTNVTVIDIAPTLIKIIEPKFKSTPYVRVVLGDFFEHTGEYDLIIEQTFFCALPPRMRQKYVSKMHQLLAKNGTLFGLLFNKIFETNPPFGGSQKEYELLFKNAFDFIKLKKSTDSIAPRSNSELFFEFKKNSCVKVNLYQFEGIIRNTMDAITTKFEVASDVLNVSINSNFMEVLIVSTTEIPLEELQKIVSSDQNRVIHKITQ
jgi:SAM-dependent methyltransferase